MLIGLTRNTNKWRVQGNPREITCSPQMGEIKIRHYTPGDRTSNLTPASPQVILELLDDNLNQGAEVPVVVIETHRYFRSYDARWVIGGVVLS